jgi:hypothetical protein
VKRNVACPEEGRPWLASAMPETALPFAWLPWPTSTARLTKPGCRRATILAIHADSGLVLVLYEGIVDCWEPDEYAEFVTLFRHAARIRHRSYCTTQ